MAETLPANPAPAFAPTSTEEPRVEVVGYGDGYELHAEIGLNTNRMEVTVPWRALTQIQRDLLLGFFRRHNGVGWFWWTPPGENAPRKFRAPRWTCQRTGNSTATDPRYDINANFREAFDLS